MKLDIWKYSCQEIGELTAIKKKYVKYSCQENAK